MKTLRFLHRASLISVLISGSGDTWTNLAVLVASTAVFGITTFQLHRYERSLE